MIVRGYSADQVRRAEAPLLAAGVPLMRRAAAGLAVELRRLLGDRTTRSRIVVLVGSGDNGGDALFACAELAAAGADVRIVPTGSRMHAAGLAEALARGAHLEPGGLETTTTATPSADSLHSVRALADSADLIVDGIVGTGSRGALRGGGAQVVRALRGCQTPVVAVDIPSGIDPDTGALPGDVLAAEVTVTFGAIKAGLLRDPARSVAGRVVLIDIGLDLTDEQPLVDLRVSPDDAGPTGPGA